MAIGGRLTSRNSRLANMILAHIEGPGVSNTWIETARALVWHER